MLNKRKSLPLIGVIILPSLLSGCGAVNQATMTQEKAQALTAEHFAAQTDDVNVTNFSKGVLHTKWRASYQGKLYNCHTATDGMFDAGDCEVIPGSGSGSVSSQSVSPPKAMVMEVQKILNAKGYDAGPADGIPGKKTNKALASYQIDKGYKLTDGITEEAYNQLKK